MSSHSVVVEDLVANVSEVLFFRDHLPRPLLVGLGHALPQERVVLWISRCVCIEQLHPLIRCSLRSPGLMALHQLPPRLELGVTALRQTFLTAFGHTALGQKICRLGPDRISPVVFFCWPEGFSSKTHKSGDPVVGTPSVGAPSPKFGVFFPSPAATKIVLSSLSWGVFQWNCERFKAEDPPTVRIRALCEIPAACSWCGPCP